MKHISEVDDLVARLLSAAGRSVLNETDRMAIGEAIDRLRTGSPISHLVETANMVVVNRSRLLDLAIALGNPKRLDVRQGETVPDALLELAARRLSDATKGGAA